MLYRALLLALATAHAWNECAFPDVDYFVTDEGIGTSFAYGAAAMNGKLYTGGYMQGHLALVGVTASGDVSPEPSATMWGDVQSPIQVAHGTPLNLSPLSSLPARCPYLSPRPPQSTGPLCCGDGRDRQDDQKLVHAGLGARMYPHRITCMRLEAAQQSPGERRPSDAGQGAPCRQGRIQ